MQVHIIQFNLRILILILRCHHYGISIWRLRNWECVGCLLCCDSLWSDTPPPPCLHLCLECRPPHVYSMYTLANSNTLYLHTPLHPHAYSHTPHMSWYSELCRPAPPLPPLTGDWGKSVHCRKVQQYITEQCIQVYWGGYTVRRSVMTHIVGWAPSHILQQSSIPAYSMKTWTDYHHQFSFYKI